MTPERGNACNTSKHLTSQQVTTAAHQSQSEPTGDGVSPLMDGSCDGSFPLVQFGFRYNQTLCDDTKTHSFPSLCAHFHNEVTLHVGHMTFYHTHLLNY